MNWDAVGALAELAGAAAVVITLAYLGSQLKQTQRASADHTRIYRATGILDIIRENISNEALRATSIRNWGLEPYYRELADRLGVSVDEATLVEWNNGYYFWMWWGQFASTHEQRDREELAHVIAGMASTPGMMDSWENSPLIKPLLDDAFVKFVDEVLKPAG